MNSEKIIKNSIHLLLLVFLFTSFGSCRNEIEDAFDKPAFERLQEARNNLQEILASSEMGWKVAYYTNPASSYGAYNILMKFNDKKVTMQGDDFFPSGKYTSKYDVGMQQSINLTFSGYNKVISSLANPDTLIYGAGLGGDNDFIWKRTAANKDTVYFKTRKTGTEFTLIKNTENWDDYFDDIHFIIEKFTQGDMNKYFKTLEFENGTSLIYCQYHNVLRALKQVFVEKDEVKVLFTGVAFTGTGIEFQTPITFNGKTITGLTFDKTENKFIANVDGLKGRLFPKIPSAVFPGNLNDRLFVYSDDTDATYHTYPLVNLCQELREAEIAVIRKLYEKDMDYYYTAIQTSKDRKGKNIATVLFLYTKTENGMSTMGIAAEVPINIQKNVGGRKDQMAFSVSDNPVVTGEHESLIKNECINFAKIMAKYGGKNYLAYPNVSDDTEYYTLGSVDDNIFFELYKW